MGAREVSDTKGTYIRSDPMGRLVHDSCKEEEGSGGLVLLVIIVDSLSKRLVYRPWQKYLRMELLVRYWLGLHRLERATVVIRTQFTGSK